MSHSGSNPRRQTCTTQEYKSWSHGMTNASFSEMNMLRNSSKFATSVPINLSIKLGYVSVNSPRETYFVDALHTFTQCGTYTPGSYNQMLVGQMPVDEHRLQTRTLDKYTRAGLPEYMVNRMSGAPPETTQDRTKTEGTHPVVGQRLKSWILPGIERGPPDWKADLATATYSFSI